MRTQPAFASVVSGTTQTTATTAQSSLSALGLGWDDRTSANFSMFRTATTVATSFAASELYCGDPSSMVPSVSESSYWDNESSAILTSVGIGCHNAANPYRPMEKSAPGERTTPRLDRDRCGVHQSKWLPPALHLPIWLFGCPCCCLTACCGRSIVS